MCEHLGGCSMLEKGSPRYALCIGYALAVVCIERERSRTPKTPEPTWIWNGKSPIREESGNRGETPDRAVGSLGHLGYLTGEISDILPRP